MCAGNRQHIESIQAKGKKLVVGVGESGSASAGGAPLKMAALTTGTPPKPDARQTPIALMGGVAGRSGYEVFGSSPQNSPPALDVRSGENRFAQLLLYLKEKTAFQKAGVKQDQKAEV